MQTYYVLAHIRDMSAHAFSEVLGVYVDDKAAGRAFAAALERLNREHVERFIMEKRPGYVGSWKQPPRGLHLRATQGAEGPETLELHEVRMRGRE